MSWDCSEITFVYLEYSESEKIERDDFSIVQQQWICRGKWPVIPFLKHTLKLAKNYLVQNITTKYL